MLKKICIVTGSRSEYGLLYWLMKEVQSEPMFQLQLIATGMHLSPEFGLTINDIENDGFNIDRKIEMLLSSDTAVGITKSIGLGVIGFADALAQLKPDILVLLGDRFETLAAAQAAFIAKIPIAHIHGGELTLGAYDDGIRHSITKMSHMHFVATQKYANRVMQLGEDPQHVHFVGAMVLDSIKNGTFLEKNVLEKILNIRFNKFNFLVTYHPETLSSESAQTCFNRLLNVLSTWNDTTLIFTKGNADTEGRIINEMIDRFCTQHACASVFMTLGHKNYLSLLKNVDIIIGNSSSGIIEAPYFDTPTVNIGDRQAGRIRASSVIDCASHETEISLAIKTALSQKMQAKTATRLYGEGNVAKKIVKVLKKNYDNFNIIKKGFRDIYE